MSEDIVINGKVYPMWQSIVEQKDRFIGGIIVEHAGFMTDEVSTKITDIRLFGENESTFIAVDGEEWGMVADVDCTGISGAEPGVLHIRMTFAGGDSWTLHPKDKDTP